MGESASEHGDRPAVGGEGGLMRGRVDPASQPAVDGEPRVGELVAELLRRLGGVVTRLARPDDADTAFLIARLQLPEHIENDRWIMDFLQQLRILRVGLRENAGAGLFDQGKLRIKIGMIFPRGDHRGDLGADPLDTAQSRTGGLEDRGGRAETFGEPPHPHGSDLREHVQDDGGLGVGHGEGGRLKVFRRRAVRSELVGERRSVS